MTASNETKQVAKKYEPVTFWLADPRNNIRLRRGPNDWIKFMGGKFTAQTKKDYDLIKKHLGHKAFEQNRTRAPKPHPVSGYAPLSDEALDAHTELVTQVHG